MGSGVQEFEGYVLWSYMEENAQKNVYRRSRGRRRAIRATNAGNRNLTHTTIKKIEKKDEQHRTHNHQTPKYDTPTAPRPVKQKRGGTWYRQTLKPRGGPGGGSLFYYMEETTDLSAKIETDKATCCSCF